MSRVPRVLFLCTHNSARSQMAEGLLRHASGGRILSFSAGTEKTHVRPLAIRAMEELRIDISGQQSETLERYLGEPFDAVITVCDQARSPAPSSRAPRGSCTGPSRIPRARRAARRSSSRHTARCGMHCESASRL